MSNSSGSGPPPRKKSRFAEVWHEKREKLAAGTQKAGALLKSIKKKGAALQQVGAEIDVPDSPFSPPPVPQKNYDYSNSGSGSRVAKDVKFVRSRPSPKAGEDKGGDRDEADSERPEQHIKSVRSRPEPATDGYEDDTNLSRPLQTVRLSRSRPVPDTDEDDPNEERSKRVSTSVGESLLADPPIALRDPAKNRRRQGVYGAEDLLQRAGTDDHDGALSNPLRLRTTAAAPIRNNTVDYTTPPLLPSTPLPPPLVSSPPQPPSPPRLPSAPSRSPEPEPELRGPPWEVVRILNQDHKTAERESKRTGRPLLSYFEKLTLPGEPFWTLPDVHLALTRAAASRAYTYKLRSVPPPLVGRPRPGHPNYPPLAGGYQTHPVHGQMALPGSEYLERQKAYMLALAEAAKESRNRALESGIAKATELPPPIDPNHIPSDDLVKRQPFLPRKPHPSTTATRDAQGNLILNTAPPPPPIKNMYNHGITSLPLHATLTPAPRRRSHAHPTLYTSPDRMKFAYLAATEAAASRKRKRANYILPPPAYVHQHSGDPKFGIFNAILLYPELVFNLASHLSINNLVSLYAISRDFHTIIDTRITTVILSQTLKKCPESSRVFPFRSYAHLCRPDPAARIPHPNPRERALGMPRMVPGFRWLRMVMHREKVVHELMAIFAEDGVPLPPRCALALKRIWFMLDIPDNARRIGYVHNRTLYTDLDLYFTMCFFVKLDMRLNDPCSGEVRHGVRKMLLAQPSLLTVLRFLKRDIWRTKMDMMRAWIEYRYVPAEDEVGLSLFGVPAAKIGRQRFEYWGMYGAETLRREPQSLLRPDQLILREAVRRGIRFTKHYLRSMLYGYIRPDTLEDYEPRYLPRRIPGMEDEYEIDDEIGGAEVGRGGMTADVLDIGPRRVVSEFCVKVEERKEDEERQEREREGMAMLYEWSRHEREDLLKEEMLKKGVLLA